MKSNRVIPFLIAFLVTLVGCDSAENALRQKSLIYCSEGDPETFNPQLVTSATTIDATSRQIYDRLIDLDPTTQKLVPAIAENWSISDDGLRYTFTLRKNVHFHQTDYFNPTRTLNADDVVFSFNRWKEIGHPYHKVSGGFYPYFQGLGLDLLINKIYKTDQYTVVIELNKPRGSFLAHLATDFAVILSEEYGSNLFSENRPENIDTYPIGTGPFKYKSYIKHHIIRFLSHEKYWGTPANAEQLIFDITNNDHMRFAKLLTQECDLIAYPLASELSLIQQNERLVLQEQVGLNVGYWAFNTSKAPFDNVLVRKALAHAIDIDTILKAVYYSTASKASNIIPPSSWAYSDQLPSVSYSPEKARELLMEAGYEDGFEMNIWAMPVQRPYNPNATKMAQLIQANLADIGIRATIVKYDWSVFRDKLTLGEHDSVLLGWTADNADPDNFFSPMLSCSSVISGSNRAMWCDESYDQLITKALDETSQEKRYQLYLTVQKYLLEQMPLLPIAHANRYQAQGRNIIGMGITPYGGIELANISKTNPEVQ